MLKSLRETASLCAVGADTLNGEFSLAELKQQKQKKQKPKKEFNVVIICGENRIQLIPQGSR